MAVSQDASYSVEPLAWESFCRALSTVSVTTPQEVARKTSTKYLFRVLTDQLHAKTMLVELDYTDRVYLDDFAAYYVRCFRSYARRCKRLHFFGSVLDFLEFERFITTPDSDSEIKQLAQNYKGFIVVRPIPHTVIGRTVLAAPSSYGTHVTQFPATRTYTANLFGRNLKIENSLVFQEQDTVISACATTALWMSLDKASQLFESGTLLPAAITDAANTVLNRERSIPSRGLLLEQLCNAIKRIGLEPEVVRVTRQTPVISLLCAYVRFGIPVILGVEVQRKGRSPVQHAVTVVGFCDAGKRLRKIEAQSSNRLDLPTMMGQRIKYLVVHDDQIGPFNPLDIKTGDGESPVFLQSNWNYDGSRNPVKLRPTVVIVPVYNKVRVKFLEFQKWVSAFTRFVKTTGFRPSTEWDLHLVSNNEYKTYLKRILTEQPDALKRLLTRQHPRYIWRALLTANSKSRLELLGDATEIGNSFPLYDAVWHDLGFKKSFRKKLDEVQQVSPDLHPRLLSYLSHIAS
ncbi:MAG: hypothetical protein ABSA78_01390 [Candidatus Sulfotelmatobacter sp.]|jgi:hypothetical protein